MNRIFFIYCLVAFGSALFSQEEERLKFQLQDPTWSHGILSTTQGGIVECSQFRLQAREIIYHREREGEEFLQAKGDIILDYGDAVLLAEQMSYSVRKESGFLYNVRGGVEPWFFGSRIVELCPDGEYILYDAYFTTSELREKEWCITATKASLNAAHQLFASHIQFRVFDFPILALPGMRLNLDSWHDSPLRYNLRFGGRQGTRVEFIYEIFSWYRWKNFLRLELSLKRGLGGGFETHYHSSDHQTHFEMINYVARDISLSNPNRPNRFRFQGLFTHRSFADKFLADLSWDKMSDRDIPSDYTNSGIDIKTADPTTLLLRWQENEWIGSLQTIVRVNTFQTLKQELPTLSASYRPFTIGRTGIIFSNLIKWSFLEFKYANQQEQVSDYRSTRFEYLPRFYRPLLFGPVTITPYANGTFIHYGDGPQDHFRWVIAGTFGNEIYTSFSKPYNDYKHVMEPYANYQYITFPTTNPNDHFIFDITDGWFRLDQLRFGLRQLLLTKNSLLGVQRLVYFDVYAYSFFDTQTIQDAIPRIYTDLSFEGMSRFRHVFQIIWNRTFNQLDAFNYRTAWTISDDLAFTAEYRHRSKYYWRKADQTNFILDSFRSEQSLRDSSLSDRRDTFLLHLFFRFRPNWALHVKSRHGWHRLNQPPYNEFEIDLLTTLRSVWHMKLSVQRREDDSGIRWSLNLAIKLQRPCGDSWNDLPPRECGSWGRA